GQHQRGPPEIRAARKIAMRDAREQVEALRVAADDFARDAARDSRDHHAVARESLQVEGIRAEPPEVRRAIQRDVDESAPGVLDARLGELREYLVDARAHHARRVEWIDAGVAHAPAEQQP